jgi:hypothetical protein
MISFFLLIKICEPAKTVAFSRGFACREKRPPDTNPETARKRTRSHQTARLQFLIVAKNPAVIAVTFSRDKSLWQAGLISHPLRSKIVFAAAGASGDRS